ncbi:hypothetical protein VMT65_13040 [Nocardia sp. CDC153]|uniref:hypothetical protein n=1 Tax=Nocardia sp. CDC153 TaxID=3112167 RepID=UPI002DB62C85|nr:hypothetical protein [Nocardia sp. CDC153]MEC3953955.1 hypothetical protein [Nocardia sp. CDC153]
MPDDQSLVFGALDETIGRVCEWHLHHEPSRRKPSAQLGRRTRSDHGRSSGAHSELHEVVGLLWGAAALLGSFGAVPRSLTVIGLVAMVFAVLVGVPCAVAAIAATGRASRFVRVPTRLAAKALLVTAAVAVFIDATLLITLLTLIVEAPRDLVVLPVTLGALVSVARISIAVASAPRLGSARALAAT